MRFNRLSSVVVILLLLTPALPFAAAQDGELPDAIVAERISFHPEGIEWDAANERFLTGSLTEGTIFEIADDGAVTPFIEDENLTATIGIHIDEENERLLVCNSDPAAFGDPSVTGIAQLGIFDLNTGELLHFLDLGALLPEGRHFCNDVTVDADGNAYVTDTFSPVIYQVTPDGEVSVFVQDDQLGIEVELESRFFGLDRNGVVAGRRVFENGMNESFAPNVPDSNGIPANRVRSLVFGAKLVEKNVFHRVGYHALNVLYGPGNCLVCEDHRGHARQRGEKKRRP